MLTRGYRLFLAALALSSLVVSVACGAADDAKDLEVAESVSESTTATPRTSENPPTVTPTSSPAPTKPPTETPASVKVVESGYATYTDTSGKPTTAWGAIVRNESTSQQLTDLQVTALFYDAANVLLKSETQYLAVMFPGQTTAAVGTYVQLTGTLARMDIKVNKPKSQTPTNTTSGLLVSEVQFVPDRFSPKITAKVQNPFTKDLKTVSFDCVAKAADGTYVALGASYIDLIPAGTTAVGECRVDSRFPLTSATSYEAYASVSSITSFVD